MRAKEFITEQHSIEVEKRAKGDVRQLGQTQPKKEYHPSKFKAGKLGVPKTPMHPHDISSQHEDNKEYGSKRGDLSDEANAAMPGAFNVETLPSDFYGVYRLGMGLAAGDRNIAAADNIGKHPFFMPFAPEEHDRFEKEISRQGHKVKSRTSPQSLELSTVNTTTPVAKRKANKYGI
jgi:hypothetical protein